MLLIEIIIMFSLKFIETLGVFFGLGVLVSLFLLFLLSVSIIKFLYEGTLMFYFFYYYFNILLSYTNLFQLKPFGRNSPFNLNSGINKSSP